MEVAQALRLLPGILIALFSVGLAGSRHPSGIRLVLVGTALSLTAYLHSEAMVGHGAAVATAFAAAIIPLPFFLWLLSAWLFDDAFAPGRREACALALIWVSQLACFVTLKAVYRSAATVLDHALLAAAIGIPFVTTVALMASSVRIAVRDAGTDLVEPRRILRRRVLTAVAGAVTLGAATEVLQLVLGAFDRASATLVLAGVANVIVVTLALGFVRVDASLLFPPAAQPERQPDADDDLRHVIAKIEQLMQAGLFLDQELTIGKLAQQAGHPEYKVRRAINGVLGYRNFNQYLNTYRTRAASERLAAPDDARTKVMAIALEVGFKSLASFNKAFREQYGMTPTEFRRQARTEHETLARTAP